MDKVQSLENVKRIVNKARKAGKKIVTTNGCFDILHIGHVRNLEAAKRLGDILIIGVNSDSSVRQNKGPLRPIVPARERAELIASLEAVDHVFIFSSKTPFSWIEKLRPDIHVKSDVDDVKRHPDFLGQKSIVEKIGGKIILVPHKRGYSTSKIIDRIVKLYK